MSAVRRSQSESQTTCRQRGCRFLDVRGTADYLGTTERHIRRLVSEGRIPYAKLGPGRSARLRFDVDRLAQWVDEHSFDPKEEA